MDEPDLRLPGGSEIHAAMPRSLLRFVDLITDAFKLMRDRDDIRLAVGEAIDAADVAAHSAVVAGQAVQVALEDAAKATTKLRTAKDLIVTATD